MRYFNTSGPCDPEKHYTILRKGLIDKGQRMVDEGRFFMVAAPFQSGKTTYFQLLMRQLQQSGYTAFWLSFENLRTIDKAKFFEAFSHKLHQELAEHDLALDVYIHDPFDLQIFFEQLANHSPKTVLIIDEFNSIPESVFEEVLHGFRELYHRKRHHCLQSLMLVGEHTLVERLMSSAPFFDILDKLTIPFFSRQEVHDLIQQYEEESEQTLDEAVIDAVYEDTQGQPGLVNRLCAHLVEEVATDRNTSVKMIDFLHTLKHFLTEELDPQLMHVVKKGREKPEFILQILFHTVAIPYSIHNQNIQDLALHGIVANRNGFIEIPIPLYAKVLMTDFRPDLKKEQEHYLTTNESSSKYVRDGKLNLHELLTKYREYVLRRELKVFDTEHLHEGAWYYSLEGYLNFWLDILGGETMIEIPPGQGRNALRIFFQNSTYLLETEIFTNDAYIEKGRQEFAEYLKQTGFKEGSYIVFSKEHSKMDTWYTERTIGEIEIYTYLISTHVSPTRY